MAEKEEIQEEPWEEITLNMLYDSKIEFSDSKSRKRRRRKHSMKWLKTPMAIPEVILELQEEESRENALRCLSTFLLEKGEEDPENYYRTGYLLYHSCGTMAILLQEVLAVFAKMTNGTLNVRSSKRLANVLTLLQSVAANHETRGIFVNSCVPNFLIPLILFENSFEVFENVRAVALSVVGILCQAREPKIIQWAIKSEMVEICQVSIQIGNELSKVVTLLADDQHFCPRVLFHVIRCYVLLCNHRRGFCIVMDSLPDSLINGSFHGVIEEFPVIQNLLHQLCLTVGKVENHFHSSSLPHTALISTLEAF